MKRSLASLATVALTLSLATPALASPNFATRHKQPRVELRAQKQATLASYRTRSNRNQVRALYNSLVQAMMPSLLTVTGGETSTDLMTIARPGTREIDNWSGAPLHCTRESKKCGD